MPLIQLQTNLKSLTFGRDRPGGGSSNQPYITVDIPQNFEDFPEGFEIAFQGGNITIPGGLGNINIPGGTVNIPGGPDTDFLVRNGLNVATDVTKDLVRLGKYFAGPFPQGGSPSGLLFTAKQNLLSRISTKTQFSGVLNEGVYTPLSSLTQAGINAFGLHVRKQGLIPFIEPKTYINELKNRLEFSNTLNFSNFKDINRLVRLTGIKIDNSSTWERKDRSRNQISEDSNEILAYGGGPNSIIGIGKTRIKFATDRFENPLQTGRNNWKLNTNNALEGMPTDFFSFRTGENVYNYTVPGYYGLGGVSSFLPDKTLGVPTFINKNSKENGKVFEVGGPVEKLYNPSVYKTNDIESNDFLSFDVIGLRIPRNDLKTYQVGSKLNFTTNQFKPILRGGAGAKYLNALEALGNSNNVILNKFLSVTLGGGLTFEPNFETSVYVSSPTGSLKNSTRIFDNNTFTLNTQQLQDKAILSLSNGEFPDFRKTLIDDNNIKESSTLSISPSYKNARNRAIDGPTDSRINYASPGQKGNIISYTKGKINTLGKINITDRLNALPLYKSKNVAATQEGDAGGFKNDLVKFRIAAIDTNNPTKKTYMHFRAYIDSFSDQYNANWNQQKYMGRGELFYKYDNFQRDINLSFTVAAQSKPEIMVMYRKLNYLASTLAPDYTPAGYMAGNLVQLTMGGWCYELPGFIRSLTLDVPEESPWEIGIDDEGLFDSTVKEMPHICKVTGLTFTPIHTFRPSIMKLTKSMSKPDDNLADNNEYGNQRYLALKATNNNYDSKVNWYI
tara:strand:+ start:18053 stop:20410 length:2358 start_codon:yes stop_codon:yes gene_type:complete